MSVKVPRLSDSQETAIRARYCAEIEAAPPCLADLGLRTLGRISPPNWTLEWSLPGWLGEALDLPAVPTADLTLANVYGLAYVRLQDDLADGEMAEEDRPVALLLSTVLYQKWLQVYARLFSEDSPFWSFFERYMDQWVAATLDSHRLPTVAFQGYHDGDLRRLGDRGAPLKICAIGVCLLAEREELIPQLESALDHLLIGAVLFDHVRDWTEDLASGQYNAFVAHMSALSQVPDHAEANRRAVLAKLVLGKAGWPYFDVVQSQLRAAIAEARAAGVFALADYVLWLHQMADRCRGELVQDAQAQLRGLSERVLGPASALEISVAS